MVSAERVVRSVEGEMDKASCCSKNCSTTIWGGVDVTRDREKRTMAWMRERYVEMVVGAQEWRIA